MTRTISRRDFLLLVTGTAGAFLASCRPVDGPPQAGIPTLVPDNFTPAGSPPEAPGAFSAPDPVYGEITFDRKTRLTPTEDFYRQSLSGPPYKVDLEAWRLTIDGMVNRPLSFTYDEVKAFEAVTETRTLECIGNPLGGSLIGTATWTGFFLRPLLDEAGIKEEAIRARFYSLDGYSTAVDLEWITQEGVLMAYEMNGEPIPKYHGFPVRVICPGWAASTSAKWLKRIWVRDIVHDGPKMEGDSYRVPRHPVAPGSEVPLEDFVIIESMPVKSIITSPEAGTSVSGRRLAVRGHAWAGDHAVSAVDVSIDFGATWQKARLQRAPNRYSWQTWSTELEFPSEGYFEVW